MGREQALRRTTKKRDSADPGRRLPGTRRDWAFADTGRSSRKRASPRALSLRQPVEGPRTNGFSFHRLQPLRIAPPVCVCVRTRSQRCVSVLV
ncbi:hypothetical protein HPB50_020161 [Hyalomma asiaticum]|uniref:Uncharacterized protein n=1 Tax=Hyalomma asiaticum TaxID=266040 RepID=A0ACB7TNI8_HYAAI|nr:hypothetical protein HPB50_020161 [Hyalomma asiaticum]